jgi:hypothetical protein
MTDAIYRCDDYRLNFTCWIGCEHRVCLTGDLTLEQVAAEITKQTSVPAEIQDGVVSLDLFAHKLYIQFGNCLRCVGCDAVLDTGGDRPSKPLQCGEWDWDGERWEHRCRRGPA